MIRSHFGVLAIAAMVVLTGCGEDKKAQAPAALTIAIGSVAPLTGGIAHLGKDNENGARLAVEEAKAEKIRIGGKEAVFELLAEDDQEDAKVGNTVAQKLVDAKVAGVVGHLNSGTSIPASNIYSGANIPMITGSATNPELTERGLKGVFRVVGRDDQQGPAVANYLIANAKPKVVAIIDDATAYGKGLANEVEKTLKAAGVKVLAREQGTNKTVDWKAVLTKLKGRGQTRCSTAEWIPPPVPCSSRARSLVLRRCSPSETVPAPTRWVSSPEVAPTACCARRRVSRRGRPRRNSLTLTRSASISTRFSTHRSRTTPQAC